MSLNKPVWPLQTSIYEVNLRQYTAAGTLAAFEKELPRLRDMGIETLWFMPLTPISAKNRKGSLGSYYACSDYCAISPEFGTAEDFRSLVTKAHALGFKVIIDWVANHTGWDHIWTQTDPGYYKQDTATGDFKIASGMDDIIELDFDNPSLRKAMITAMQFWLDTFGIDGFRCDLAFWVQLDFWQEARAQLDPGKSLFWFGEFDPLERPEYYTVFDAAYTWTWMHQTERYCKGETGWDSLTGILQQYQICGGPANIPVWFTSNHDENSWNGTEYEKYGNRAMVLAVFSICWKGIPLIYSGQELPNTRRLAFFEKDTIHWNGEWRLHEFYKTLLQLRHRNPSFFHPDARLQVHTVTAVPDAGLLVFSRFYETHTVLVLLNLCTADRDFSTAVQAGIYQDIFSGEKTQFDAAGQFFLPAGGFKILEKCE